MFVLIISLFSETMRKYPPVAFLDRECKKPYDIPNSKLRIEKDVRLVIPIHAIHNDPQYYPQPEKFDPERFSDNNRIRQNNYIYLPFGDGPRNCIGNIIVEPIFKYSIFTFSHIRYHDRELKNSK